MKTIRKSCEIKSSTWHREEWRTYKNSAITTVKKGGPSATTKPIMQESDRMLNYELTCLITSPSVSTAPDACLCQPLTPPHWGIHISHLNMPKLSQPCSPHLVHHGDDSYLVRESSFLIFITPSKPTHHLNILISQLSSSKHVSSLSSVWNGVFVLFINSFIW